MLEGHEIAGRTMRSALCAWAGLAAHGAHRQLRHRRLVCSASGGSTSEDGDPLDAEARAWGDAAASASLALGCKRGSTLHSGELLAYCATKGVGTGIEPWDAAGLLRAAEAYAADERLALARTGPAWDALDDKKRATLAHRVCNGEGDATYIDPGTGYTVFAAVGHLRRGDCCGVKETEDGAIERIHRCRHCPYDDKGILRSPAWRRLQGRIALLDYVRARTSALAVEGDAPVTAATTTILAREAPSGQGAAVAAAKAAKEHASGEADVAAEQFACSDCEDKLQTVCTRCKGWRILITPETMLCPQCDTKGFHPCMTCTPWRPPTVTHFGG